MTQTIRPTKFEVRQYMERRFHSTKSPPPLEEIRRQLGWRILSDNRFGCKSA